ncbi:hypothetical protein GYMLUDRAFT_242921 [Collybiopsis luxurians FD-317 M1]|uniref:Uncharacterized protein n=1 Tax=Collybiopsis luxurians FD-317 M1 TaxID=944289 RepID=A0A0D0BEM0_9AGAR|nr:hypothetical protein GYMLUDRAFT_242921 [Collybiopsis luxurians FD-317 M1]
MKSPFRDKCFALLQIPLDQLMNFIAVGWEDPTSCDQFKHLHLRKGTRRDGHSAVSVLRRASNAMQTVNDKQYHVRILPGIRRALVYKVPVDDRTDHPKIKELGRYYDPGYTRSDHPHPAEPDPEEEEGSSVVRQRYRRPADEYLPFKFSSTTFEYIAQHGVSAMMWDESTGRDGGESI